MKAIPKNTVVIFGMTDVEEAEARKAAESVGYIVATATFQGQLVSASTAYKADGFVVDGGLAEELTGAIIFECNPACAGSLEVVARCDHHNPGDYGFGFPPELYFEGSSLGQLLMFLGLKPTEYQLLVAASDHCPAAAYAGRCQMVTPDAIRLHRLSEKVAFYAGIPSLAHKADPGILEAIIGKAVTILKSAPKFDNGVRDLRTIGFVEELPEAALRSGESYVADICDKDRTQKPTGNRKIVLGGHTAPKIVQDFMSWAATFPNRVGEPYGDPVRGFAGVIVKPR